MSEDTTKNEPQQQSITSTVVVDGEDGSMKPMTEKELKKAAAKAAKLEKFQKKQEKIKKIEDHKKTKPTETKVAKEKSIITYDRTIVKGEKKDINGPMPNAYSPKYVEAVWYDWWVKSGFFKPEYPNRNILEKNPKGKFTMVIPPPNVTGHLHLGHALTNSIEDCLTRWHRMCGRTTLWNPGCDHAGISTQIVVEKQIWFRDKLTRHDLGREKFLEKVWEWKREKGDHIYDQLKCLGASVDWDRAVFTMDPKMCRAVNEAFVRLHEKSLIYRSKRMVNWCCTLRSVISDIEVKHIDVEKQTFLQVPGYAKPIEVGVLHKFAYPVVDPDPQGPKELIVATTRIETMLGDTAVVIHPNDERYKTVHGKQVQHPFLPKKLPIILDEYVDISFGTGAMKVTPAHDHNDYELGRKHQLDFVVMLSDDGLIASEFGKFSGLKRFDCRVKLLEELKEMNLYHGWEHNKMVVPICERSNDIIEPLIKYQWYVNCKDAAKKALRAVETNQMELIPQNHISTWKHWLSNIQDWCISRQNWWGHRIPVYFARIKNETNAPDFTADNRWFCGRDENEAKQKAAKVLNVEPDSIDLQQDEDVLDTWFSSGLFPFAIFGWPDETDDLKAFYPGELLETGQDILFFWVARMVMLSYMLNDRIPFEKVYLHSIIRDAHGRKMSKSLGNVIDPIHVINGVTLKELHQTILDSNLSKEEKNYAIQGQTKDFPNGIPECGTDALRFGLLAYTHQGRDINLDIKRLEGYRNFCNKIWNAVKFVMMYLKEDWQPNPQHRILSKRESKMEQWILGRLNQMLDRIQKSFETYRFGDITDALYEFWIYRFCNVFVESVKPILQKPENYDPSENISIRQTLYTVVECFLRALHPLMPFITEELYQRLPRRDGTEDWISICIASYPNRDDFDSSVDENLNDGVKLMEDIVHKVRSLKIILNLQKGNLPLYLRFKNESDSSKLWPFIREISVSFLSFFPANNLKLFQFIRR